ncbi:MAG: hypothetical protein A2138_21560 [Deltaproteobacteria bacterium RBG_16_71_12]|nr:MAG: hypothetical protein A2138_21560 [Deltaproteobacteria bacterium RBG_16_71_12]
MKRRGFLKLGIVGGVVLAAGGTTIALLPGDRSVRPRTPLAALTDAQFAVLAAVAARVMARTTADPVTIAHSVDSALRFAPPEVQHDLGLALGLLDNALVALITGRRPAPFTQLDEAAQDAAFHAWGGSRLALLRSAYQGLRKLCLAAHYATPAAAAALGYVPSIAKPEPPPITARGPLLVDAATLRTQDAVEMPPGSPAQADGGTP